MRPPVETRRLARLHGDWPRLSVGDRTLPVAAAVGSRKSTLRPESRARQHEQAHHLDTLLWSARVFSRVRARLQADALPGAVRFCAATVSDMGPREAPATA